MDAVVSEWVCEKGAVERCSRRSGDQKEVQMVLPDGEPFLMFVPPDIDLAKLPNVDPFIVGIAKVIGWPSWFPIFNRKVVYHYRYPVR